MLHITPLGYAALADTNTSIVQTPWYLKNVPVRVGGLVGLVYCGSSLAALRSTGSFSLYGPVIGILFALGVFIYRTVTLFGGYLYRKQLRVHEQRGLLVFVPAALVRQATIICEERYIAVPPALFDSDFEKTRTLIAQYVKDGYSPKVQKI